MPQRPLASRYNVSQVFVSRSLFGLENSEKAIKIREGYALMLISKAKELLALNPKSLRFKQQLIDLPGYEILVIANPKNEENHE